MIEPNSNLREALKNRAKSYEALMPQWLSAGWSGEITVVQSFLRYVQFGYFAVVAVL